ncbi:hypothetical protein BCR36DRAFT_308136 [Piromyces finnis]|uniref:Uncharacterized protein n=1 Tax=Piromyces finnis TaxID=1754191 RepID=A0A1Y1UYA9_9FUNG|nr:hypothetical protein BCR36DRAFT_308136 [Piromyces finnis]|eukprot:ORX42242.1 hypothetical protein BCR36DRAFT_308136 [Piromyces finnis]
MSEVIKSVSQKRLNELKRTVITDAIDLVLNTICDKVSIDEKDKSFTVKKLTKTIELIYKLLGDLNNDQFPSEIIKSLKPHITSKLNNTFCFKQPSKNNNSNKKSIFESAPIIFYPNIQLALEISYKEIKKDIKLQKLPEHYHFFVFPLTMDDKEYIITYAEENKYSKREIIEILLDDVEVSKDVLPHEIKTKYGFI